MLSAAPGAAQTLERSSNAACSWSAKADYKPFGFRDTNGAIVGFEPDLARDVAGRLGVRLELEPVVSSNRMQFLQQGKIDLMIATMNDKPDRRLVVGIIEPLYYSSGVNVLGNKKVALKNWEQLKGQKVCGIRAPGTTSRSPRNTARTSSRSRARPRPRSRCSRAIASAGCAETLHSPSASPIRNGPASR